MTEKIFISVILPLKLEWFPSYYVQKDKMETGCIKPGTFVRIAFARKEYVGVIYKVGIRPDMDENKIQEIISIEDDISKVSENEIRLWEFVSNYYLCSIGEVFKAAYPINRLNDCKLQAKNMAMASLKAEKTRDTLSNRIARLQARLEKKNTDILKSRKPEKKLEYEEAAAKIRTQIEDIRHRIAILSSENIAKPDEVKEISLSQSQEKTCSEIKALFGKGMPVLLNGITGSGKTEIYLKLASGIISKGQNVLYLVPEIALSRQLEDRLSDIFGKRLLIYHSRETSSNRRKVIEKIEKGHYILLGTRSSIFLPHRNLGMVIIDEEHDTSYKQDSPAPRYNGRDTAIVLAGLHHANVILGSATPSLESIYNCETGRYRMVMLNERFYNAENAKIEIIDTKAEKRKRGMRGAFSLKLIHKINKTLENGGQVMILRGRRAYSPIVQCEDCGDIPKCPNCNVSLTYHKTGNRLVCHYCGHNEPFTGKCKKCGGEIRPLGYGTQRIEEEAREIFPEASIARLDGDTSQSGAQETQIIRDFSDGRTNILIGTQMVAKGFDFKGLMLVAVIQADTILGQQDFRADEKALQLLEQFRGRCGRRNSEGTFIIQTSQPEHPIYNHLNSDSSDNNNILQSILSERKLFNYPPYSRLINIIIKDTDIKRLEIQSERIASNLGSIFSTRPSLIPENNGAMLQITGPYAPVVDKIAMEYIRHIRIMLRKDNNLSGNKLQIKNTISEIERTGSYYGHITIDVDPAQ